jgi:hypothetical protein
MIKYENTSPEIRNPSAGFWIIHQRFFADRLANIPPPDIGMDTDTISGADHAPG